MPRVSGSTRFPKARHAGGPGGIRDWSMAFSFAKFVCFSAALALAGGAVAQEGQVQTKQYDDGGIYEGTFKDGLQHGTGTYTLPNGYEYVGDWVEGEIRGKGVARFPNGSVYEGEFTKGKPNGIGKIVFTDGGTYEGSWEDGKITGQGLAIYANGVRYEGGFLKRHAPWQGPDGKPRRLSL